MRSDFPFPFSSSSSGLDRRVEPLLIFAGGALAHRHSSDMHSKLLEANVQSIFRICFRRVRRCSALDMVALTP